MIEKAKKCPTCGNNSFVWEEKSQHLSFKKMEMILKSEKTPYQKKIALFECLKKNRSRRIRPRVKGKNWLFNPK